MIINQHAVLHRQIKALNIEDGEEALEYLGEEPTEGGWAQKRITDSECGENE